MGKENFLLTKISIDEEHGRDDEDEGEATDTSPAVSPMRLIDYARSVNAEKLKESTMVPGVEEQLTKGRTEEKKKHKGGKEKKNKERKKEKEGKKKKDKKEQEEEKLVEKMELKDKNVEEIIIQMKEIEKQIKQAKQLQAEQHTPGSKPSLLSITSINMTGPSPDLIHEEESIYDEEDEDDVSRNNDNNIADRFAHNNDGSATDTSEESTCQLLAGQTSDADGSRVRQLRNSANLSRPRKEKERKKCNKMSSARRNARELRCNFDDDPCDYVANDIADARMEFIEQNLDKMETEPNSHSKMHFCLKRIQNFCSNINQTLNQAVFEETYESAKENCERLVKFVDSLVYEQLTGRLGEKIKKCLRDGCLLETDIPVWALSPTNLKIPTSMEFRFINSDVDTDCPQSSPHLTFTADSRTGALVKKIERLMMLYRTLQREADVSPQYFVYYDLLKNLRINLALTSETQSEDNKISDAEAENE